MNDQQENPFGKIDLGLGQPIEGHEYPVTIRDGRFSHRYGSSIKALGGLKDATHVMVLPDNPFEINGHPIPVIALERKVVDGQMRVIKTMVAGVLKTGRGEMTPIFYPNPGVVFPPKENPPDQVDA